MNFVLLLFSLVATTSCFIVLQATENNWNAFCSKYRKRYSSSLESARRRSILEDNLMIIKKHNGLYERGLVTYEVGLNEFADLTFEEFERKYLGVIPNQFTIFESDRERTPLKRVKSVVDSVKPSVDLRNQGIIPPVRNQILLDRSCGSCWAFAAVGTIETLIARTQGIPPPDLSEQQLNDCSLGLTDEGVRSNYGCSGALTLNETLDDIVETGLQDESTYRYTASDDTCVFNSSQVVARIGGFKNVETIEEIVIAVNNSNSVDVGIAVSYGFMLYKSGIYTSTPREDNGNINHAVIVVGYNITSNYLILRNSWGQKWGEDGYMRLGFKFGETPLRVGTLAVLPTL